MPIQCVLLEYGISPNDASDYLNMCVHNIENSNYLDMAEMLLDAGADPNRDPECWFGLEDEVLDLFEKRGFIPSNDVFMHEDADDDDIDKLKTRFQLLTRKRTKMITNASWTNVKEDNFFQYNSILLFSLLLREISVNSLMIASSK